MRQVAWQAHDKVYHVAVPVTSQSSPKEERSVRWYTLADSEVSEKLFRYSPTTTRDTACSMNPEQKARQQIDAALVQCGWVIQDYKALDLSAGRGIALREVPLKGGTCDYLLLVDRKPVGIVEAKPEGTTLSGVADQSAYYGDNLPEVFQTSGRLPFLYESTGVETFFRDERDPHPRSRRTFAFHRPETLAQWMKEENTLRFRLAQMPFAHPLAKAGMRDCQIEAITQLEQSFANAHPRALIQMATGAGKTFTACAFIYRLIRFAGRSEHCFWWIARI